jgi:hypothetical protein
VPRKEGVTGGVELLNFKVPSFIVVLPPYVLAPETVRVEAPPFVRAAAPDTAEVIELALCVFATNVPPNLTVAPVIDRTSADTVQVVQGVPVNRGFGGLVVLTLSMYNCAPRTVPPLASQVPITKTNL